MRTKNKISHILIGILTLFGPLVAYAQVVIDGVPESGSRNSSLCP